jgi:hypothetical protein
MMRAACLLLGCALQSVACNTASELVMPDGTALRDVGQIGGDHVWLVDAKYANGDHFRYLRRSKQSKSLQDVVQGVVAGTVAKQTGMTERTRLDTRADTSAVRSAAAVETRAIDAGVEKERIQAELQESLSRIIQTR